MELQSELHLHWVETQKYRHCQWQGTNLQELTDSPRFPARRSFRLKPLLSPLKSGTWQGLGCLRQLATRVQDLEDCLLHLGKLQLFLLSLGYVPTHLLHQVCDLVKVQQTSSVVRDLSHLEYLPTIVPPMLWSHLHLRNTIVFPSLTHLQR